MACTELLGMITGAFEFIGYSEHRLKSMVHLIKTSIIVFSINQTHYLNKQVGVVQ